GAHPPGPDPLPPTSPLRPDGAEPPRTVSDPLPPASAPPTEVRRPDAFTPAPSPVDERADPGSGRPREDPRSVPLPTAVAPARRDPAGFQPPPGPLLPSADLPEPVSVEELERPTARDRLGLVLAILVPPVGIVLAIANAVSSSR